MGFSSKRIEKDKVCDVYEVLELRARETALKNGGSISHHNGIGKLRKKLIEKSTSAQNINLMKGVLDPNNVFAINNTIYKDEERTRDLNSDQEAWK